MSRGAARGLEKHGVTIADGLITAFDTSSTIEQLGETIAEMAARIHAATYELLVLLSEFDAQAGWNNGFLSCAHWLHWRTGIDLGAAREGACRACPGSTPAIERRDAARRNLLRQGPRPHPHRHP